MWRVAIRVYGGDGLICEGNLRDVSAYAGEIQIQKAHGVFRCLSEAGERRSSRGNGACIRGIKQVLQLILFRRRRRGAIHEGWGND